MIYKNKLEIESMEKHEFIEYAKQFNIHKCYDFDEFLQTKQDIIDNCKRLSIALSDIVPDRNTHGERVIKKIINKI